MPRARSEGSRAVPTIADIPLCCRVDCGAPRRGCRQRGASADQNTPPARSISMSLTDPTKEQGRPVAATVVRIADRNSKPRSAGAFPTANEYSS